MLLVKNYLAPSPIQGLGVYTAEFIARGSLFWRLNPKFDVFVQESEIDGLPPHMREYIGHYGYPHLELPGVVVLDCDNGKFMNHSDAPNTDFRRFAEGYAVRDIAAGEEIVCNYAEFDPSFKGFSPVNATETIAASVLPGVPGTQLPEESPNQHVSGP